MSKITSIPGDVYVSEIFPKLPISQVILITNGIPNLLNYTKRYLSDLGRRLGMGNNLPANQVLKNLSVPDINSQDFIRAFEKTLPPIRQLYSVENIGKLYDAFESDYKKIVDQVYGKTILDPVHYSFIYSSPDTLIQDNFPIFYETFVDLLQKLLTDSDYLLKVQQANQSLKSTLFKYV